MSLNKSTANQNRPLGACSLTFMRTHADLIKSRSVLLLFHHLYGHKLLVMTDWMTLGYKQLKWRVAGALHWAESVQVSGEAWKESQLSQLLEHDWEEALRQKQDTLKGLHLPGGHGETLCTCCHHNHDPDFVRFMAKKGSVLSKTLTRVCARVQLCVYIRQTAKYCSSNMSEQWQIMVSSYTMQWWCH